MLHVEVSERVIDPIQVPIVACFSEGVIYAKSAQDVNVILKGRQRQTVTVAHVVMHFCLIHLLFYRLLRIQASNYRCILLKNCEVTPVTFWSLPSYSIYKLGHKASILGAETSAYLQQL